MPILTHRQQQALLHLRFQILLGKFFRFLLPWEWFVKSSCCLLGFNSRSALGLQAAEGPSRLWRALAPDDHPDRRLRSSCHSISIERPWPLPQSPCQGTNDGEVWPLWQVESGLEANCNYLPLGSGSRLQDLTKAAQTIVSGGWKERCSEMESGET